MVGGALALAVVAPHLVSIGNVVLLSGACVFAIAGLSLTVLTGYAGQVSLGQFTFVALGAAVGGRMLQLGYPHWMAMVYAMAAVGVAALVIGVPALRVRGIYLAITTLGFAVVADAWLSRQGWLVHVAATGETSLSMVRARAFGIDLADERAYYYLCLVALVAVGAGVWQLSRTGAGRVMMAVRDNEEQAAALGIRTRRVKLLAFVVSGMIAGLAGFLYGGLLVSFSGAGLFAPSLSFALLGQAMVGGITTVTGAVLGAAYLRLGAKFVAPVLPDSLEGIAVVLLGGLGVLGAALLFPGGASAVAFRLRDRLLARVRPPAVVDPDATPPARWSAVQRAFDRPRCGRARRTARRSPPRGSSSVTAATSSWAVSRCTPRRARSSGCSARTAPARRRCSTSCPASSSPMAGGWS